MSTVSQGWDPLGVTGSPSNTTLSPEHCKIVVDFKSPFESSLPASPALGKHPVRETGHVSGAHLELSLSYSYLKLC